MYFFLLCVHALHKFYALVFLSSIFYLPCGNAYVLKWTFWPFHFPLNAYHISIKRLLLQQAIDAVDNGINHYETDQPCRYVNNTSLSNRVGRLNLDWMDSNQSSERENEAFQHAMELAGSEFLEVWYSKMLHVFNSLYSLTTLGRPTANWLEGPS